MPVRVFDTQVAAGMAGIGSTMALDRLVEHIVGVTLAKAETLSDWRVRPLTKYVCVGTLMLCMLYMCYITGPR